MTSASDSHPRLSRVNRVLRNPLARQNAIYFAGSLLALLLSYAYHFATGRLLGPRSYAPVAAIVSLYFLLLVPGQLILTLSMRYAATFLASGQSDRLRALFRHLATIAGTLSLTGTGLFVICAPLIANFLRIDVMTVLALAPAVFLVLLTSVNRGLLQGEQKFAALSGLLVIEAVGKTVCAVALLLLGLAAGGAVLALGIGLAVSYLASFWPLRDYLNEPTTSVDMRQVLRFAGPTTAAVFGITFLYTADVLLVKHFLDPSHAGIYGSVSAIGRVVFMATASITGVMFPRVTSLEAVGGSGGRTLQASVLAILVVALGIIVIFATVPRIVLLPFGSAFDTAAPYLPAFAAAVGLFSLANLLCNYFLAVRDRRFVPVLGVAAVAEVVAISGFHDDLWQVIWCLLAIGSGTVLALWSLYLTRH